MAIVNGVKGDKELRAALKNLGPEVEAKLRTLVVRIATLVQADAVRSIQRGSKTGRTYKRGSVSHRASAPGEAPATDSGSLASSIQRVDDGIQAAVGTGLEYGKMLEFGTRHILARPWLNPALEKNRQAWESGLATLTRSLKRTAKLKG